MPLIALLSSSSAYAGLILDYSILPSLHHSHPPPYEGGGKNLICPICSCSSAACPWGHLTSDMGHMFLVISSASVSKCLVISSDFIIEIIDKKKVRSSLKRWSKIINNGLVHSIIKFTLPYTIFQTFVFIL